MILARFLLKAESIASAPPNRRVIWKVSTGCRGQPPASSPNDHAAQDKSRFRLSLDGDGFRRFRAQPRVAR